MFFWTPNDRNWGDPQVAGGFQLHSLIEAYEDNEYTRSSGDFQTFCACGSATVYFHFFFQFLVFLWRLLIFFMACESEDMKFRTCI